MHTQAAHQSENASGRREVFLLGFNLKHLVRKLTLENVALTHLDYVAKMIIFSNNLLFSIASKAI
jgi:hypothetical protein